jgi:methyl-accepting chemotaxis protein
MRFSVRAKLYAGFGAVLALMCVLALVAIVKMGSLHDAASKINDDVVASVSVVDDISSGVERYHGQQRENLAATDQSAAAKQLAARKTAIDADFATYAPLISNAQDRAGYTKARSAWQAYEAATERTPSLIAAKDTTGAVGVLQKADAELTTLRRDVQSWGDLNDALGDTANADADSTFSSSRAITLILLAVAILVAAINAFFLTRSISLGVRAVLDRLTQLRDRDVTDLRGALRSTADGDLTVEVAPHTQPIERISGDEIGAVATAVNEIGSATAETMSAYNDTRAALGAMIGQVSATAGSVSSASEQMASTSEEAGRAVTEIASAVGDVATGAEQQVRMVDETRAAAEETNQVAGPRRRRPGGAGRRPGDRRHGGGPCLVRSRQRRDDVPRRQVGRHRRHRLDDHRDRRADQPAGAQRRHRGSSGGRSGSWVRGGGRGGPQAGRGVPHRPDRHVDDRDRRRRRGVVGVEESSASTEQVSASTQETSASTQRIAASAQELSGSARELEQLVSRFRLTV